MLAERSEASDLATTFCHAMQRRPWTDVCEGVSSILSELSAMVGSKEVVRIQSDRSYVAIKIVDYLKNAGVFYLYQPPKPSAFI